MDVGWLDGWMDVGWLEKAELKPTQPSLAGAWLSLAIKVEMKLVHFFHRVHHIPEAFLHHIC